MSEDLHLLDEQKESLRRRENATDTADLHFRACPVCAFMALAWSKPDGTGQTTAALDGSGACCQCNEIRARHGELFDYMLFVIRGQRLLAGMVDRAKAAARAF